MQVKVGSGFGVARLLEFAAFFATAPSASSRRSRRGFPGGGAAISSSVRSKFCTRMDSRLLVGETDRSRREFRRIKGPDVLPPSCLYSAHRGDPPFRNARFCRGAAAE